MTPAELVELHRADLDEIELAMLHDAGMIELPRPQRERALAMLAEAELQRAAAAQVEAEREPP